MSPNQVKFYSRTARNNLYSLILLSLPMFVVARLTLLVRQRDASVYAQVDALAILQIALVALTFFVILVAPNLRRLITEISRGSLGGLVAYYFFSVVSALWSVAPTYTLYRAGEMIVLSLAVYCACGYTQDLYRLERRILVAASLVVVMGVAMNIRFGGISIEALHTNSYSAVAAMIFVYCLAEYLATGKGERRRCSYLRNFGIFGAVFVLVGTSSASNISALVGVIIIGLLSRNVLIILFACLFAAIGALLFSLGDLIDLLFPGKSMSQIATATGRSWLWQLYLEEFYRSPWIGNGFAVTSRTLSHYTTNTHNGYFAVLLGTGILGGAIFLLFLSRVLREGVALMTLRRRAGFGATVAVGVGLVNNLAVSIVGEQWNSTTMGFILFLVLQMRWTFNAKQERRAISHGEC